MTADKEQLSRKYKLRYGLQIFLLLVVFCQWHNTALAQGDARVTARISANQITVGDQVRLFLEAQNTEANGRMQWPLIPDSLNGLEVVEKGKIDTIVSGGITTYKQRLIITGFDSGVFQVPSFLLSVIPNGGGEPFLLHSDSFSLLVQTVAVDTTQAFKPIKGIIFVNTSWKDYVGYIVGGGLLLVAIVAVVVYLLRRKKPEVPKPQGPVETTHERTLRLLAELDQRQLWQKNKVKEYYVELTDIVRTYIEERFRTPALELTTDELLTKVQFSRELQPYYSILSTILHTADLAKFAKAQPLPQEHTEAMEHAKQFVVSSKPVIIQISNESKPETAK